MNLRLMGVGAHSPARLWRETLPITVGGLMIAITSGLMLFTIALHEYYASGVFRLKMVALVAAIVFYSRRFDGPPSATVPHRWSPRSHCCSTGWSRWGGILVGYE
ncbi:MAG: hypothetical protein WDO18_18060 [Acidobacteriota bacterium]